MRLRFTTHLRGAAPRRSVDEFGSMVDFDPAWIAGTTVPLPGFHGRPYYDEWSPMTARSLPAPAHL